MELIVRLEYNEKRKRYYYNELGSLQKGENDYRKAKRKIYTNFFKCNPPSKLGWIKILDGYRTFNAYPQPDGKMVVIPTLVVKNYMPIAYKEERYIKHEIDKNVFGGTDTYVPF